MKFYPKYGSVLGKLKSSDTFPQSPIIRWQLVGEVPTNTMDYPDLDQAFVKVCITLLYFHSNESRSKTLQKLNDNNRFYISILVLDSR